MSLTREDLQAISELMDMKLEPVNKRLDKMDERLDKIESDIDIIKEDVEITREASNKMLEWLDTYWRNDPDKPFPAREEDVKKMLELDKLMTTA